MKERKRGSEVSGSDGRRRMLRRPAFLSLLRHPFFSSFESVVTSLLVSDVVVCMRNAKHQFQITAAKRGRGGGVNS